MASCMFKIVIFFVRAHRPLVGAPLRSSETRSVRPIIGSTPTPPVGAPLRVSKTRSVHPITGPPLHRRGLPERSVGKPAIEACYSRRRTSYA